MEEQGMQVEWLYKGLTSLGLPEESLMHHLDAHIKGSRNPLPMEDYLKLISWGMTTLQEPHLGLKIATKISLSDFGLYGFLSQYSATVNDMFMAIERYQKIFMTKMFYNYSKHDDLIEVRYQVLHPHDKNVQQDVEFAMGSVVVCLRAMLGDEWQPVSVNFSHEMTGSISEYDSVLGVTAQFNQVHNSVVFAQSWLATPISNSNPQLLELLFQQADKILSEMDDKQDFVNQVRLLIATRLGDESYNIEVLSQQLNITSRTLHRRLKKHDLTYQSLREEIVLNLAKDALTKTDASVTDIALQLGYSESSSFVRAFKRLCGVSPLNYRNG